MQIYCVPKYKLANGQLLGTVTERRSDVVPEKTMRNKTPRWGSQGAKQRVKLERLCGRYFMKYSGLFSLLSTT